MGKQQRKLVSFNHGIREAQFLLNPFTPSYPVTGPQTISSPK